MAKIKNKKLELYFQNQSLLSTKLGPKDFFETDPFTKNRPEGLKNCNNTPNLTESNNKDRAALPKQKKFYISKFHKYFLNLIPTQRIVTKGQGWIKEFFFWYGGHT